MGAAYGTAKSGTGIAAMAVMRPEAIMKSIIPVSGFDFEILKFKCPDSHLIQLLTYLPPQVVMAGIIAIYGVVVAVLIAGQLAPAGVGSDYTLYK